MSGGRIHPQTVSPSLTGFGKGVCSPQYCLLSILIQGGLIRFHVGKCLTYTGPTFREVSKGGGMCFDSKFFYLEFQFCVITPLVVCVGSAAPLVLALHAAATHTLELQYAILSTVKEVSKNGFLRSTVFFLL